MLFVRRELKGFIEENLQSAGAKCESSSFLLSSRGRDAILKLELIVMKFTILTR